MGISPVILDRQDTCPAKFRFGTITRLICQYQSEILATPKVCSLQAHQGANLAIKITLSAERSTFVIRILPETQVFTKSTQKQLVQAFQLGFFLAFVPLGSHQEIVYGPIEKECGPVV
jgi:hypothetical protein